MKDENKTKASIKSKVITRRDFVSGTMVGSGVALLSAKAPGVMSSELGQRTHVPYAGLTKDWTGPGGVGDYASSNGNTHLVVNAAHSFRDLGFEQQISDAA